METLLIPALLDHHWPLLRWAFETQDRRAVILDNRTGVEELGLRHLHNDLCYPFILIAGQVLSALRSGKYDLPHTSVLISQAADACRGSCGPCWTGRALRRCGCYPSTHGAWTANALCR